MRALIAAEASKEEEDSIVSATFMFSRQSIQPVGQSVAEGNVSDGYVMR